MPAAGTPSIATFASSTTAGTALPSLLDAGIGLNGTLGITSASTTVTESLATSPPAGDTALGAARSAQGTRSAADTTLLTPIAYLSFSVPVAVTVAAGTTLSFTVPQVTAGLSYDIALYAATAGTWTAPFAGPAVISGTTLTVTLPSFSIAANANVLLALYSAPASVSPTPSPTASPSPSPSPTASPTPVASPNSLLFDVNSPAPESVAVTEANSVAPLSGALNCSPNPVPSPAPSSSPYVALVTSTVTPGPTATAGAATTFTLQPGSETGSCTLTVTDTHSGAAVVTILNASTSLNVLGTHRNGGGN